MIIVGLTGSIGSGKTTVSNLFKDLGAYVIDWDELARKVTRPHSKAWNQIVDYFGKRILNDDMTIDRHKLGDMVFSNRQELARLNRIVHPEVFREDERATSEIKDIDPDALIIKDIPLLLEVTRPISVDKVIVVSASRQTQLRRLGEKGIDRREAQRRIRSQLPIEEKVKSGDFVINNDGPLEDTRRQVEQVYSALRKQKGTGAGRFRADFRRKKATVNPKKS